jgi:rod shape-determining protein MreC
MLRLLERFGDWFLLAGLVLISVVTILTANHDMVRGLRARALELSASIENQFANAGRYMRALDENERLHQENIRLSSQVALSREALLENDRLTSLLGLPDSLTGRRVAARVISKDITRQWGTLVIGVGRQEGVEEGMAVVDSRGVVGVVNLVSEHHAQVKSYLNPGFSTPVKIQPHLSDGILSRDVSNPAMLEMKHVPRTDPVAPGQLVVTSGYSGIFRPGLPVGVVDTMLALPGRLSWRILVAPAAPLGNLHHVFVLLDKPDPDRLTLEIR